MSISQAIPNIQSFSGRLATPVSGQRTVSPLGGLSSPIEPIDNINKPDSQMPLTGGFPSTQSAMVRVGHLWLPNETVSQLQISPLSQSPLDIARNAVAVGLSQPLTGSDERLTQHALMVGWGEFAHEIGLIDKLSNIPIPQKSVVHTPCAKVLTFLMGTLTGITHLKDLNEGPHPLAHDFWAIRAWGLVALPHYTGVSRTLAACDEKTVAAITDALHEIADPFIDKEVRLIRARDQPLILDMDIAPR